MNESNFESQAFEKGFSPAFIEARDALMAGEPLPAHLVLTEKEREEILLLARLGRFTRAALHANTPSEGAEETALKKANHALARSSTTRSSTK
jgi:hypothetical protein